VNGTNKASLAVWDISMPVSAGGNFTIKIGAKATDGRKLAGCRVEVSDASGKVVASGALGDAPLPGSEALYWCELNVPAPAAELAELAVRLLGREVDAVPTRFSVAVSPRPEHRLTVTVTETNSAQPLADVEVRLGPFHARTGADGRAELRLCNGGYILHLWRAAHIAAAQAVTIDDDVDLKLTMTFVPEDHPDARWVR
jgi:hypothetical protein